MAFSNSLHEPKTHLDIGQHKRSDSSYSSNYSFINMYEMLSVEATPQKPREPANDALSLHDLALDSEDECAREAASRPSKSGSTSIRIDTDGVSAPFSTLSGANASSVLSNGTNGPSGTSSNSFNNSYTNYNNLKVKINHSLNEHNDDNDSSPGDTPVVHSQHSSVSTHRPRNSTHSDLHSGSDRSHGDDRLNLAASGPVSSTSTIASGTFGAGPDKLRHSGTSKLSKSSSETDSPRATSIGLSRPPTTQQLLQSDFDMYGFKKTSYHSDILAAAYNKWYGEYAQYTSKNKKKWLELMKHSGLAVPGATGPFAHHASPSRFPPKSDKVKKLIRRGIPAEWRGSAWFFYAGGHEKLNKHAGIYEQIVRDTAGIRTKDTEVIERDLNRTFPDNVHFNSTLQKGQQEQPALVVAETANIKALRRVLSAFAHYQPHIGYCQSLNFLAGLLLLFMTEERAFWMLVILTERIIPKVHSANLEGVHIDQGVLMLCIKEYIPPLWSILGKNFEGETLTEDKILARLPPVTLVTSSWFMSVFVGVLPIETALRVWDILWYEGSKTIFRMSLTICKLCLENPGFQSQQQRARAGSGAEIEQIELFQFMQQYPKAMLDPNTLIDNCFKKIGGYGFGLLSQDEINKCREFVSKQRLKMSKMKSKVISAEMSEDERIALESSGTPQDDGDIHDVYGFNRSIMSGIAWNKSISNRMKKKFTRVASK